MLGEIVKSLLDENGVGYKNNSRSFVLTCPRCCKREKLYISKTNGRFVCWVCRDTEGYTGSPEFCLVDLIPGSLAEIKEVLYGKGQKVPVFLEIEIQDFFGEDDTIPGFVPDPISAVPTNLSFRDLDTFAGTPGAEYMVKRGIPVPVALEYGIQYWPQERSVVFPAKVRGLLVGWQTRRIDATEYVAEDGSFVKTHKSNTMRDYRKDKHLMFNDRITGSHAILCEGPIDALKAHLCGGNVATLGKSVSRYQLELLKYSGIKRLYIAQDPDAFVESARILKQLAPHMEIYNMIPPAGDLGEMSFDAVREMFANAKLIESWHVFIHIENPYAI